MSRISEEVAALSPEQRELFELLLKREGLDVSRLLASAGEALASPVYLKEDQLAPSHVFLTGATGYLGIHILYQILRQTEAVAHCLVRASSKEEGRKRLAEQLAWYFPEEELEHLLARINPVVGDLRAPRLDIDPDEYESLCSTIDFIYHAAADVRHIGDPAHFKAVNVDGTRSILALTRTGKEKFLHHISTTLVAGAQSAPEITTFSERDFDINQHLWALPYVQTKFLAERVVRQAMVQGCRAVIHRTGAVSAHSHTGRFQRNIQDSMLYSFLRSIIKMGVAPYAPGISFDMIPVDFVAQAIVKLSLTPRLEGETFHLVNPKQLDFYDLVRALQSLGYAIRLVDYEEYVDKLPTLNGQKNHPSELTAFLGYGDIINFKPLKIESALTQLQLKRLGLECPPVTPRWLKLILQHCIDVDYIEPPIRWDEFNSVVELFK